MGSHGIGFQSRMILLLPRRPTFALLTFVSWRLSAKNNLRASYTRWKH